jgi:hypothetical protein
MRLLTLSLCRFAAVAALAMWGLGAELGADDQTAHHDHGTDACARACNDCQRACDSCAMHCAMLLASGRKEHDKTLRTCQDCADACTAAARIVSRQGPFIDVICKACAETCGRCGKVCEQYPQDQHMKRCAEECRKCEKACRDMLQHLPANP